MRHFRFTNSLAPRSMRVTALAIAAAAVSAGTLAVPVASAGASSANTTAPLSALVATVRSGVLRIEVETCDGRALGTGLLVGPREVATVEHVIDGAQGIRLIRAGKLLATATVIGSDSSRDLALLRTSRPIPGYRFTLENRPPALGEDVAALGFPLGLPLSVSKGLVSGSDRTIPIDGLNRRKLIQTDAAVNPGNSGGPLISLENGKVIGLVDLGSTDADGLAFAVSSQVAKPLLQAWKAAPQPVAAASCGSVPSAPTVQAGPAPTPPPTTGTG